MDHGRIPLLPFGFPRRTLARWRGRDITGEDFLGHVAQVASTLPGYRYALNLCEQRYPFMVAFAAAMQRGQTNLLPPNRAPLVVAATAADYPDCYVLIDQAVEVPGLEQHVIGIDLPSGAAAETVAVEGTHLAAIAFTSGSTGQTQPNPKRWADLVAGARLARARFGITAGTTIVATVPAQHMYGLEMSVLISLVSGATSHCGRPFFPLDIREALEEVAAPRVLVTTPFHLKACVEARLAWPQMSFIISATAPLSAAMAHKAEVAFGCPVLEIYGCTEAGSLASRRTVEGNLWRLYDGLHLEGSEGGILLTGDHLPEAVVLNDRIEIRDAQTFVLQGRNADLINIAGKRASLGHLNHKLNEIEGVLDGIFVFDDTGSEERVARLAALVNAPGLSERALLDALASRLDPAFLPRRIHYVDALPRNECGKLPRAELLALLGRAHRSS